MGILDRLKRLGSSRDWQVSSDLRRLDAVQSGLGNKAVDYVLHGRDGTVLSTLSTLGARKALSVCDPHLHFQDAASKGRRVLLCSMEPYDVALVTRYVEVLTAAVQTVPDNAVGTPRMPAPVRVFFTEAFGGLLERSNGRRREIKPLDGRGLTVEHAVAVTRALGGGLVDVIAACFAVPAAYSPILGVSYRTAVDVMPLLREHLDEVVTATAHMRAAERAELIGELAEAGLVARPPIRDLVLDLTGDKTKSVRKAAFGALHHVPQADLEALATSRLDGPVAQRAAMVDVLGNLATPSALEALARHRQGEKTGRIVSAIDTILAVAERGSQLPQEDDDAQAYTALNGARVEVPALPPLPPGEAVRFTGEERDALRQVIADENAHIKRQNQEYAERGWKHRMPALKESLADEVLRVLTADPLPDSEQLRQNVRGLLYRGHGARWARDTLARLPRKRALEVAAWACGAAETGLRSYTYGPFAEFLHQFLLGAGGDVRHLEAVDQAFGTPAHLGNWQRPQERRISAGDYLRRWLGSSYSAAGVWTLPVNAVWPYIAENLAAIDEAFGLAPPVQDATYSKPVAIFLLGLLPGTPARYFGPLLEAATGTTKTGRAEARALLADAPEVDARLIAQLGDSRQAVRAGAAQWLAERGVGEAIPAIEKRLKKEKSEVARAAMLSALDNLGGDLDAYLGPDALLKEAEQGLKSAKLAKLDWLGLHGAPVCRYRSGGDVPREVITWWLALGFKLKQIGGNALFHLYLDQLEAEDAQRLSLWVLESWIAYDTAHPPESEAIAYAQANVAQHYQYMKRWDETLTEERAFANLKRSMLGTYKNSGAAFRGLLALAARAPAAEAADRVRAFLKQHGPRTAQCSALLELLAEIGEPAALQVLIAAATRLKQKSVQAFAGTLLERVAENRGWSFDELADRTVPTAGFDDECRLELPVGEADKVYVAVLDSALKIELRNPDGKVVKALPAGSDDNTKASKKQFSTTRRELKQVVTMQSQRLYEALCAERRWLVEDWVRDFHGHPVMRRLVERVVWLGLDADNALLDAFRPTAEGDFTNADDGEVDLGRFAAVQVAHGALLEPAAGETWAQHLKDYEVAPLFDQFGRALLKLPEELRQQSAIEDRKGWVTDAFTIRGAATRLGYERGETLDGGFFNQYCKPFEGAGVVSVIEFSGNSLPEENVPAALINLSFHRVSGGRPAGEIKLAQVPPVLLSECWNDYHALAAKAAFHEDWAKQMPWL